jgi:hypothetical protein
MIRQKFSITGLPYLSVKAVKVGIHEGKKLPERAASRVESLRTL